ncbi:hypothetical protein [Marinobacter salsuginis]|uniref:Uncharacterized protein n=1 Tax=Marinobacter salsuginis TaxID=418719 RepID=A0A5M3Q237_9GAMM|nr:hypothetical protein [Marinobacter salsuginis]GBO89131.1 hypothetical protein MSSD14B_27990 [Marinobacter salsuginis]
MFSIEDIANIDKTALKTLIEREADIFGVMSLESVERDFLEYANGEGAYEDFRSWRQAWRGYVEARREELEEFAAEMEALEAAKSQPATEEKVIAILPPNVPAKVLSAEHQMALF